MLKIATVSIALTLASPALAGQTCQTVGQFTYCNGDDGYRSTTNQVGNNSYTNETDSDGQNHQTNCRSVGQFTYCN